MKVAHRNQGEGLADGRAKGRLAGAEIGAKDGGSDAQAQLAAIQQQQVEAEQAAAAAEAAERQANCGAPLFVEGYCPTDEEIAQESQTSSW
jgi:hypothetical protein